MRTMAFSLGCWLGFVVFYAAALDVRVQLEGVVPEPFSREVVFSAANAQGEMIKTWERTLDFENGIAEDTLPASPAGVLTLSAKTDWTLRVRVVVTGDEEQPQAHFTGDKALPGGDLNGDNRIDALDFAILRFHWYSENSAADITGNGKTDASDYALMKNNWYRQGDEP